MSRFVKSSVLLALLVFNLSSAWALGTKRTPETPGADQASWEMFLDCRHSDQENTERLEVTVSVISEGRFDLPNYRETYVLANFTSSVLEHGQPLRYSREQSEFKLTHPKDDHYNYVLKDKVSGEKLTCIRPVDGGATGSN